tara:strand:+ start:54 stop:410 length:357 start_codon:yes stop_codon:yes gene_type:complete
MILCVDILRRYAPLKAAWDALPEDQKAQKAKKTKRAKGKKKKDPNKPKRGKSAYIIFGSEQRSKPAFQSMKQSEIMKAIGAAWKECSDADKIPFQKLADADKVRYQKEMESYTPPAEE